MKIETLDPTTPLLHQFQQKDGPITLINTFVVPPDLYDAFIEVWKDDAGYMKASRGCIRTQLHRGTAGSRLVVNVAVWESTEALLAAFSTPEFQPRRPATRRASWLSPRLPAGRVDGICVA